MRSPRGELWLVDFGEPVVKSISERRLVARLGVAPPDAMFSLGRPLLVLLDL